MKTSALRQWLRALRAEEGRRLFEEPELPPPPTETSWFMMDDRPALFLPIGVRLALRKRLEDWGNALSRA